MTLHWWMHWFWVTIQFLMILGNPLPSTTVQPQTESQNPSESATTSTSDVVTTTQTKTEVPYVVHPSWQTFRVAKAIGVYPQSNTAALERQTTTTIVESTTEEVDLAENITVNTFTGSFRKNGSRAGSTDSARNWTTLLQRTAEVAERYRGSGVKKDSKIMWISTTNKTNSSMYNENKAGRQDVKTTIRNSTNWNTSANVTEKGNLAVLPLQEEGPRFRLVLNKTGSVPSMLTSSSSSFTNGINVKTFNQSGDKVVVDDLSQSQLLATAASILDISASESTRLSRAHSAFSTGFQKDQAQANRQSPEYDEDTSNHREERMEPENSASQSVDIAAITGSCMATVVLLSTMGSVGFIMYRRRYLNPPQTLNSDKCSNPDSSGYIDDSTIRDNSEEMYSLDNDSFLNSLEAMTIQNYWTDSVKHTKL